MTGRGEAGLRRPQGSMRPHVLDRRQTESGEEQQRDAAADRSSWAQTPPVSQGLPCIHWQLAPFPPVSSTRRQRADETHGPLTATMSVGCEGATQLTRLELRRAPA